MMDEEEQDEMQDWQAHTSGCYTERDYWKFWIRLYGLMRESEE